MTANYLQVIQAWLTTSFDSQGADTQSGERKKVIAWHFSGDNSKNYIPVLSAWYSDKQHNPTFKVLLWIPGNRLATEWVRGMPCIVSKTHRSHSSIQNSPTTAKGSDTERGWLSFLRPESVFIHTQILHTHVHTCIHNANMLSIVKRCSLSLHSKQPLQASM